MSQLAPSEYAEQLAKLLRHQLGIPVSADFRAVFLRNVSRLRPVADYEDLGALIIFECAERDRTRMTSDALNTLVDTIRHRLARRAKRQAATTTIDELPIPAPSQVDALDQARRFVASLAPEDALIFEMRFLDGAKISDIVDRLGLSMPTVYRRLNSLKADFVAASRRGRE